MSFSLFSNFAEMDAKEWILFGVMALVLAAVIVLLVRKKNSAPAAPAKGFDTQALVYGAMCVSLAFVLSYLRFFRMPQGGSITPASMLPIIAYAYWYGAGKGAIVGLAYAVLQMIQDAYFVHPAQILLDYILAFGLLSLAGLFRRNLLVGTVVACIARFICHFVSGAIFFGEYAAPGQSVWAYSLGSQAGYLLPDFAICILAAVLLWKVIDRLRPSGARLKAAA